jgi:transcription elongation factor GreA
MSARQQAISREGKAKAEAELKRLREVRRPEIVKAIKAAREFGDLKENAEYHAAREAQGMNESRIRMLEHHLATAAVSEAAAGGTAGVGSRVSYRDADTEKVSEVTLVHQLEADVPSRKLSVESPIGAALLGTAKGDEVTFEAPRGGVKRLEILEVS